MNVLGIDPGFASLGWGVVTADKTEVEARSCGVIQTVKGTKMMHMRSSEDNIQRAQSIYDELDDKIINEGIELICTETMSWPRNAGVVGKMGIVWGVIASVAWKNKVPIIQSSPVDIKFEMTQDRKASKEKVISWVQMVFPNLKMPPQETLQEHCADAVAAVWACRNSQLFRALRNV